MTFHENVTGARTMLFVPGNRPDRFAKAVDCGPDIVVLDLEDAVAPADKDQARENIRAWLDNGGTGIVRINDDNTSWWRDDLAMLAGRVCGVMVPKVTQPDQVRRVLDVMPAEACVLPLMEMAAGIVDATAICGVPGVTRAVFGNADLGRELGVNHADRDAMFFARAQVVMASRAAGIAAPVDGVTTAIEDLELVRADAEHAARLGFTGKLCLHPRQVKLVADAFGPSEEEVLWARSVVAAFTSGSMTAVSGEAVGKPIVARARRILDWIERGRVAGT
ncbi:HpcH/HpaI aldolase/citrate lyase family protein [Amycolatopsis thermoflava]|uniref:HpcH/HpaI aldolase/citrate lyase family protein n=1 Tax=Amycolatopsis thermoflava TaxID=84480 RepID=UPI003D74CFB8